MTSDNIPALTACVPCKRRKKKCDKVLPSCSRCSRLSVKCSYSSTSETFTALPSLTDVVPEFLAARSNDSAISGFRSSPDLSSYESPGLDEVAAAGLRTLIDYVSRKEIEDVYCKNYFQNFHVSLPVIDERTFYSQLHNSPPDPQFSLLLLAMYLVSRLSSNSSDALERAMEVYPTLKGVYSLIQPSADISVELVQIGLLIASFEHCQALHQEAYLTVGACARMGRIVRQQSLDQKNRPEVTDEYKCSVWWGVVILERIINADFMGNKLPMTSEPPEPSDLLPVISSDERRGYRVADDLLLPDSIGINGQMQLQNRGFTKFNVFSTIVQATYLASLVTRHVLDKIRDLDVREADAAKLDIALQSYAGALIPPPGEAAGHYCGAYGIRTSTLFFLQQHNLEVALKFRRTEEAERAKLALQSLTRIVIHATKASSIGIPLDFDSMAFWCHKICYLAALYHIKFGVRDQSWKSDLQVLKDYLRFLEPRYTYYRNCIQEIEAAEGAAIY